METHSRSFYKAIADQDAIHLKKKLVSYIESNPIPAYILAPRIGISINCLRTFLNGNRATAFPQRKKIQSFIDQLQK